MLSPRWMQYTVSGPPKTQRSLQKKGQKDYRVRKDGDDYMENSVFLKQQGNHTCELTVAVRSCTSSV